MKIISVQHLIEDLSQLPVSVQRQAATAFHTLTRNIAHPSLQIRRIREHEQIYAGSINRKYGFLFLIMDKGYVLLRVGRWDEWEK